VVFLLKFIILQEFPGTNAWNISGETKNCTCKINQICICPDPDKFTIFAINSI